MSIEERIASLGYSLPAVSKPLASYVPAVRTGNLVFSSGQLPVRDGQLVSQGQVGVGAPASEDQAYEAARVAALNALAAISSILGSLDSVRRIVRVTGYVASGDGFTNQPAVVNGASDFLVQVFGENGAHARSAVGVSQLPLDASVEIEIVAEVE